MYKEVIKGWIKHLDFTVLDIVCLEISLLIAYIYREGFPHGFIPNHYISMMGMLIIIDICVVFFCNSYKDIIHRSYMMEIRQIMIHDACITIGLILWMFVTKQSFIFSRIIVVGMYPISVCVMTVARLAWKRVLRNWMRKRKIYRKMLVITTDSRVQEILEGVLQPYRDYMVDGVIIYDNPDKTGEEICGVPVVASKREMIPYIQDHVIDEVFIDLKGYEDSTERLMQLFVSMGLTVHVNLVQFGNSMENRTVHSFGKYTVLTSGMKFASPLQVAIKRVMDICGSLVGLVLMGIAFIIFAPIIKHQSPGPVFFSQERVGRNGRTFKIYKFRTMYPDAEERKKELMAQNKMNGLMFKMDNDPRIIPIGHFLRESSIDELPQFWNILKGDMSLVGTRPPTVDEYKQYSVMHRKRLAMKPGLTGIWQVSGRSDIVDFDKIVTMDAQYIEQWTILMDIKILWKTVLVVLGRKGAV